MAGNGGTGTAPSSAQELSIITGFSASLAIANGSLSLMQRGGLCLPSWLTISRGPQDRGGGMAYLEQAISLSAVGLMRAWGPTRAAVCWQGRTEGSFCQQGQAKRAIRLYGSDKGAPNRGSGSFGK